MKPTLTPTEYQSLSEENKGLYEEVWQWFSKDHQIWSDDKKHEVSEYLGLETLQTFRLKEPTKAEAETVEQAANKYPKGGVEEAAFYAILNAVSEAPYTWNEIIPHFVSGAKFGANWQASNPNNISRERVIDLIALYFAGHKDHYSIMNDLIEKIKALYK